MSKILLVLLLFIFLSNILQVESKLAPLIKTSLGLIQGLTAADGNYSMYLGVPYATVNPENPFGLAIPIPKFHTTFKAYNESTICPQIEELTKKIVGKIDCLQLNIYVPNTCGCQKPYPVLVWIYGGTFVTGYAGALHYGPKYLVRHNIIVVTFNYRLGPYGFMCLHTPEVAGNQGLKDQVLALKWIKNHIASFGGDSNRITISGNSAGSMSVDYHLHSPHDKLFNSVILESGNTIHQTLSKDGDRTVPIRLAEELGFTTNNYKEALKYLKTVDSSLVIAATKRTGNLDPCIEKQFKGVENMITDYTVNQKISKVANLSVLIGINQDEMLSLLDSQNAEYFDDYVRLGLKRAFHFSSDAYCDKMANIVEHYYFGDDGVNVQNKLKISDFASDIVFIHPAVRSVRRYVNNGANEVFFYVFSYVGNRNYLRMKANVTIGGAVHADEIGYLFDCGFMGRDVMPGDQLVIDRMTTMWANFIKYGNPTPQTCALLPVKWKPITKNSPFNYLRIGKARKAELSVGKRPFQARMAFWDLFYKANERWQIGYKEVGKKEKKRKRRGCYCN